MARRLPISMAVLLAAAAWLPGCDPPTVSVEETPISYRDEAVGRGNEARIGDVVCIDYTVLFPDGKQLMKEDDFCFVLGAGAVIAGFDDAIPGMRPGGRRTVECPPHKHWGRQGYGNIPPNTTLTLSIRLVSVE